MERDRRLLIVAGALLGVGLGGFVDGIVLHQILQWHHLLTAEGSHPSDTVAGLKANTLADGLFHAVTLAATAAGVLLLWWSGPYRAPGSGVALVGLMAAGWGGFNLVEGVINHHVLTLHHVRDDVSQPRPWDLAFLAFGAALLAGGFSLARRGLREDVNEADTRHG
jgi:uncharacterized membrane protein